MDQARWFEDAHDWEVLLSELAGLTEYVEYTVLTEDDVELLRLSARLQYDDE